MVERYLGLLVWADKGWKRPVVVYLGMPLLFSDSRGVGPLNLGQSQVCTKSKVAQRKALGNTCETCGEDFESRNKLHQHLGDTGHAMLRAR
uniref:C2H2-type domain-containing protein n=1 Tax=Vitis vinifera TaxID=29760 RepID=F6HKR9_VITVI